MTLEEIDAIKALKEAATRGGRTAVRPAQPVGVPEEPAETPHAVKPKGLPADYVPSEEKLKEYLNKWDGLDDYVDHEKALSMIFREDPNFCLNTDIRHVIIKCSALNDFYATNIFSIAPVARKIVDIVDFDERVRHGDPNLVDEIALVDGRCNYSFATKYCSHHQPLLYPIFDSYVCKVLAELCRRNPGAFRFSGQKALTSYPVFLAAIDDFRTLYGLQSYSYKDVDRYLWQLGKDYYNRYKN